MPDESTEQNLQASLVALIEASKRLRQKAKENATEADRILALGEKLAKAYKERAGRAKDSK